MPGLGNSARQKGETSIDEEAAAKAGEAGKRDQCRRARRPLTMCNSSMAGSASPSTVCVKLALARRDSPPA